jgi:uncharacterized membrane protein YbhN (UPF0104 family)
MANRVSDTQADPLINKRLASSGYFKKKLWVPLFSLIAVVSYGAALHYFYGWTTIFNAWQQIPAWHIGLALVLMFFTYAVRGLRIHYYFLPLTRGHLSVCLKIMLLHNMLNNLLPMRTGEASFPLMMRTYFGLSLTRATAGLVLLRLLDLQVLLCIGWLAVALYVGADWHLWLSLPILVFTPLLLLHSAPWLRRAQMRTTANGKLFLLLDKLLSALPRDFTQLIKLWLYTWLAWSTKLAVFTLVILWFATTDWRNALGATLGGELSSMIPLHTPGGLGTYEASMLGSAKLLGIEGDWVLFAGVQLHMLILLSTLLGGIVAQFMKARQPATNISYE